MLFIYTNFQKYSKYFFYLLILFFIFSKEYIVINEEFLILLSFLTVFFGLKINLSNLVEQELTNRNNEIKKQFLILYKTKKEFQNSLITILEKKVLLYNKLLNFNTLFFNEITTLINKKKLIDLELLNLYVEQLLFNFILKYNFELKNIYLNITNLLLK